MQKSQLRFEKLVNAVSSDLYRYAFMLCRNRAMAEDLAAWAEDAFRKEDFEKPFGDQISDLLAIIRDAVDPHRFRWEEPDFEQMLGDLED